MKGENSPTAALKKKKKNKESPETGVLSRKTRYKLWALAAIILLAFWSMFTGSVSLKWSAVNFTRFYDGPKSPILNDLDILEVEEREKAVRNMWNLYTHGSNGRLPRFWLHAFEAAYEHLVSDVVGVRDAALTEIAKMSLHSIHVDQLPLQPKSVSRSSTSKQTRHAK